MTTIFDCACAFLDNLFQARVEPVAEALDAVAPDQTALEEGRRGAAVRAAVIRSQLSAMCADCAERPPSQADALAAFEATKGLLYDLWRVVAADANTWATTRGPAAAAYARETLLRAASSDPADEGAEYHT